MHDLKKTGMFLLDMDGTIYLGDKLFKCTKPFLDCLGKQGRRKLFLTNNSSCDRMAYADKLCRMGIDAEPDDVFTSGEATAIYLNERAPGAKIFLAGTPTLEHEFESAGFTLVQDAPDFIVLGFDQTLTYEKIRRLCNFVLDGVPLIATHPDFICPTEHGILPDTGSMLAMVKAATGRDPEYVVGKPNRGIIDAVIKKYNVPREKLCIVGDRLYTDIAVGINSGVTSILVLSGETDRNILEASVIKPDYVFDDLGGITDILMRE